MRVDCVIAHDIVDSSVEEHVLRVVGAEVDVSVVAEVVVDGYVVVEAIVDDRADVVIYLT